MKRHFWRVYLHGLLILASVGAAILVLALMLGHDAPWQAAPQRLVELLVEDLAAGTGQVERRLDDLHRVLDVDLEVLRLDGSSLARAGRGFEPLEASYRAQLLEAEPAGPRHAPGRAFALPLGPPGARQGLLLMRWPMQHGLQRLLLFVVVILAVVAASSAPLARAVTRPLERLTRTARALASGDLQARSGIQRKDEVGELARTMDEMAARLAARLQAERELLAAVSHELRTPLARLQVALELAEEEPTADVRARLAGMAGDLAELSTLIENVLLTARLERQAGGWALEPRRVLPEAFLAEAVERFRRHHPGRALELQAAAVLPALDADSGLLGRALDNLLENAAKYAPAEQPIELAAVPAAGGLELEVRDRGPGVEPADLPRLFEPFFRTERSRSRAQGGAGLGLTLSRRIVEAHGGRIEALLREGGGLCVRLRLPLTPASGPGSGASG